jgi:3-isopropylmalate dehydrogenase
MAAGNPGAEVDIDLRHGATDAADGRASLPDRSVRAPLPAERHRRTRLPAQQACDIERYEAARALGEARTIAVSPATASAPKSPPRRCARSSAIAARFGHSTFEFEAALLGGAAIDATGEPLPAATLELAGAPTRFCWARSAAQMVRSERQGAPGTGLLQLRKALGLFANLRPVVPHPAVLDASPIKAELLRGVDIMVVRELTGGIYFGDKQRTATEAVDVCRYTVTEIERVVRLAARLARAAAAS